MEFEVDVAGESTVGVLESGSREEIIVLAHGAGTDMNGGSLRAIRDELLGRGFWVARFNFLYKQQKRSLPDKMPKLMQTYRAVAEHLRSQTSQPLVFAGHSMGGRTASMLAAEGERMHALVLLAYPLHPAGQPAKLRDQHLPDIQVPTLCMNGTRDELCTKELMEDVLTRVQPTFSMHWLEDADHSYKAKGRKPKEVMAEIGDAVETFLDQRRSQT